MNALRQILGNLTEEDMAQPEVQNALAQLLQQEQPMPQPRYDIPRMQDNSMRFESGPEQGRVVSLDFRGREQAQPQQKLGDAIELADGRKGRYSADQRYAVLPTGEKVDLHPMRGAAEAKAQFEAQKQAQLLAKNDADLEKTQQEITAMRAPKERAAPAGYRWRGDALEAIPGGPADGKAEKPLTEFQGKSLGYGQRAANAHEILNGVGQDGQVQPGLIKRGLEAIPVVGGALGTLANSTQSAAQQQVEQAQRDFVNAVLRQESGAAISTGEFDNARKQYFPQPGDSPEVIAQKKQNREIAISGFAESAGPAKTKVLAGGEKARALFDAKKAIARGAPRDAVIQRLQQAGVDPSGL